MSTEAMKLALDHLINLQPILGNGLFEERQLAFIDPHIDCAITALQEALAQPQQEPSGWQKIECPICGDMAIATDIPAAQPQQEPVAAVAWQQGYDQGVADERISEANIGIAGFNAKVNPARNNPYTSPQPAPVQQEPVDFASLLREAEEIVQSKPTWNRFIDATPLANDIAVWMTVFAQDVALRNAASTGLCHYRKPLTDAQIIEWVESGEYNVTSNDWASHIAFARAIEAAHGIKENT